VSASLNQILLWIAVALAGYGVLVFAAAKSVYYPMRFPAGDWRAQSALGAEDVWLRASDGTKLHAWWIARPGAKWATLHLHGNAGNITPRDLSAATITGAGSSVLLLDYRGYGKSEGRPTEAGLYRDAVAGYEWLLAKGHKPAQIILHGESLGSAVAVELASRKPCGGVVLEAPFTSARAVAHRVLPFVGPLLVWGFDTKSRMERVRAPVLVIHGDADDIIAYDLGKQVFAAAREPKSLWTVEGATHNDLHISGRAQFAKRLADFYASL
jgi:fermentation-respiration switch protein FrsA (DUF1100 family)